MPSTAGWASVGGGALSVIASWAVSFWHPVPPEVAAAFSTLVTAAIAEYWPAPQDNTKAP